MPDNLTGQNISDTYQRLLQVQGNIVTNGTGSAVTASHAVTSSFAHTALSASYAISASHEIILETSSSRAEVAGTLSGLNATITELNYLDGVVSNVKEAYDTVNYNTSTGILTFTELDNGTDTVDIGVGTNDSPAFQRLSLTIARNDTPTISLPDLDPDAVGTGGTHLKVEVDASAPGIRIGTTDKPIITFVSQDGQDVSYIEADGGFSANAATATTATTATNAINVDVANDTGNAEHPITFIDDTSPDGGYEALKANANIKANPSTGNITAAGIRLTSTTDASATSTGHAFQSGPTTGANVIINGNEVMARNNGVVAPLHINPDGGAVSFNNSVNTKVRIEGGHVTASGNVSSSGNLTVSKSLTFGAGDSRIDFAEKLTIGNSSENDYIKIVDEQIKFYVNNGEALVLNDNTNKILVGYGGGIEEVVIGDVSNVAVKHGFATSGEPLHNQFGQTKLGKSGDIGTTKSTLFITGSGYSDYNGIALELEGNAAITGSIVVTGNVTASGNISSSGTVIAKNFEYPIVEDTIEGSSTGDIITWGTATVTAEGQIYYYNTSGGWSPADADSVDTAKGLLAVALADNSSKGMLVRGVTNLRTITGTQDEGTPLYLKASADGHANIDAPTTSGHVVRILGYCLHNSNNKAWFDPDKTWVELS